MLVIVCNNCCLFLMFMAANHLHFALLDTEKIETSFQSTFGPHYLVGQNLTHFWPNSRQVGNLLFWPFLLMGYRFFILTFKFETLIPICGQKVPEIFFTVQSLIYSLTVLNLLVQIFFSDFMSCTQLCSHPNLKNRGSL
jgi:hypothetical protein